MVIPVVSILLKITMHIPSVVARRGVKSSDVYCPRLELINKLIFKSYYATFAGLLQLLENNGLHSRSHLIDGDGELSAPKGGGWAAAASKSVDRIL